MHLRPKILLTAIGLSILCAIALFVAHARYPSDAALRARFFAHRADFESLVSMANEDSHLTRIAPRFTWLDNDVAWPRKNVGISEQRWNQYRQLFRNIGASEGIIKGTHPDRIIIPVASVGLVPAGSAKGLVYSKVPLTPVLKSLDESPPAKYRDGPDHTHLLVYKPIAPHWYIYYESWR